MIQKFDNGKSKLMDHVVTGDETWIYQYDPESKKQSSVWRFPGEHNPNKVKRQKSAGKQMIATFFAKRGHVTTIPLVERKTVSSEWYSEVCVPKVFQEWHCKFKKRVRRQILWHHDNANAHTAARTLDTLAENDIQLLTHPPYCPDLAPCDFFLFPRMKN